jgi:hypothetical protein
MAKELDDFLSQAQEPAPASPESTPAPRPVEEQPQPPRPPGEPPAKPPEPGKPEAVAEAEAEPEPEAQHDGAIPRNVFEAERHKRRDWKEKAVRYETEASELRKQLEEAKQRAAAPPPPAQQPFQLPQLPDFATDPQGYVEALSARHAFELLNLRLNDSEQRLRDKIGDEKVDGYLDEFKQMAAADPSLQQKAFAHRNPFGFVQKEVDRARHYREVGDDPEAFKAKLRQQWEAEQAARPPSQPAEPPPSPVAGMQPSLARARSTAPRNAPAWSGEISDDELVRSIQTRKQRNGGH